VKEGNEKRKEEKENIYIGVVSNNVNGPHFFLVNSILLVASIVMS